MIVAVQMCPKDALLAVKNLEWQKELDDHVPFTCLYCHDEKTSADLVRKGYEIAKSLYAEVVNFEYPSPVATGWPFAPNYVWQSVVRFVDYFRKKLKNEPWLFLEPDAIPVSQGWSAKLDKQYRANRRPFMGYVVPGMGHFNGVAIYPANTSDYCERTLFSTNVAWDVALAAEMKQRGVWDRAVTHDNFLFTHVWAIGPDNMPTNDSACKQATFTCPEDVWRWVNLDGAIFHRNKDGTLIDWLRELRKWKEHPELRNVPVHAPVIEEPQQSVEIKHAEPTQPIATAPTEKSDDSKGPSDGILPLAEIFIVTHWKDIVEGRVCEAHQGTDKRCRPGPFCSSPWLGYCIRGMNKYLTGFGGITVLVPEADVDLALANCGNMGIKVRGWPEKPGKGMLDHMVQVCHAEKWCPGADVIVHFDPDCIFNTPTSVSEYVKGGKPVMLKRTYTGLRDPKSKAVSDCIQWKPVVEKAIGFETDCYTMCRHPSVHPRELYPKFRHQVELYHAKKFDDYVLEQRNSFPQTFAEFPSLGAYAWRFMRDAYHWIDIEKVPPPKDHQKTYWSHGGITQQIREEIEGFLK